MSTNIAIAQIEGHIVTVQQIAEQEVQEGEGGEKIEDGKGRLSTSLSTTVGGIQRSSNSLWHIWAYGGEFGRARIQDTDGSADGKSTFTPPTRDSIRQFCEGVREGRSRFV